LLPAQVSNPVPGEHAFHANHQIVTIGCDDFQQSTRRGLDILVDQRIALLIKNARMQIDTAVMFVCLGVEFH